MGVNGRLQYAVTKNSMSDARIQGQVKLSGGSGSYNAHNKESLETNESSGYKNVGTNLYEKPYFSSNHNNNSTEWPYEREHEKPVRQKVESMQQDTTLNMNNELSTIQEKGIEARDSFVQHQQKGVVRRAGSKGIKEAGKTAKDLLNIESGESQQG